MNFDLSLRLCLVNKFLTMSWSIFQILIKWSKLAIFDQENFCLVQMVKGNFVSKQNRGLWSWSTFLIIDIDQCWSWSVPYPPPDQDFSLPKSRTLFQNNYWSGLSTIMAVFDQYRSILINIDQYWSGFFFTKVSDSVSKQPLCRFLINIDLYWSILITILIRTFLYKSLRLCFKTTFMPSPDQYWSILINIDQYWSILININQYRSGLFFTKFTDSVFEQLLCRVLINIDLYWSILINIDQGGKMTIIFWPFDLRPGVMVKWSKIFDHDHGQNFRLSVIKWIKIGYFWPWPWPKFQNCRDQMVKIGNFDHWPWTKSRESWSWSTFLTIDHDQIPSIIVILSALPPPPLIRNFLYQSLRLCFKTTIMAVFDQYRSILINNDLYWSILINIDQDFSLQKSQTLFQNNHYADSWSI